MSETVTNLEQKKQEYGRMIFHIIRSQQPISRFQVKKISKYSMTTTLSVVNELIEKGVVMEAGIGESTGGRKPVWLTVNPDGGYFIGVDFNAGEIISVVVDLSGSIRYVDHCLLTQQQKKADVVIAEIKKSIDSLLRRLPAEARVQGIGLGVPGFIDIEKGISLNYAFIDGWENVDIRKPIESAFGYPVYIENNVNAMALAYKWRENIPATGQLVYMILRSGIRIGSVLNEALYSGASDSAGEIDHMDVGGTRRCHCGKTGCLVTEASVVGILAKLTEGIQEGRFQRLVEHIENDISRLTLQDFIECVLDNDPECNDVLKQAAEAVGKALANVVMVLNPSDIVISSPLTQCGARFLHRIQEEVQRLSPQRSVAGLSIRYCQHGEFMGALGAATLAMQDYMPLGADANEG